MVALLVVHLAGFYVYFVVRLGDLRMAMREKLADLPADQLEIISIPTTKFRSAWLLEREMELNGKMYDIARVQKQGQNILVYCLHDKDEDGLLSFISAVVEMSRQDNEQAPISVIQFFNLEFVVADILCPYRQSVPNAKAPNHPQTYFAQVDLIPVTPPPQG
jgi:hypothetical protein